MRYSIAILREHGQEVYAIARLLFLTPLKIRQINYTMTSWQSLKCE
jgi:hypothetical protein